ncbi:hypothetical protein LQ772_05905 [Frateuria edaphi]|uniref:hypothetical protein n=1 Tax=Frateuria edaphi TaxID=2898793 RepID=UPI001E343666|nr:hypothetical protein [Frateuria edaphi]UGB46828.1 hypothetical protein LQ772_05905 [Frateuria edaphi]
MKYALLLLVLLSTASVAEDLVPLKKPELAGVLGLSEELARTAASAEQPQPYIVRVYAAPVAVSECDGTIASCPDVRLLITVSSGDLGERPSLFELPAQKGWQFVGWSAPSSLGGQPAASFIIRSALPEANISAAARKAWRPRTYRMLVTPELATYAVR